ncbi:MAG: VOC family protein [bacterium]
MTATAGLLHHVELYVSDLARSRVFWAWFLGELGYTLYQEWNEGVSYKLAATYIVLVQAEPVYRDAGYHRKRPGLNHLAFHATDRAQVDRLAAQLSDHGGTLLYQETHPYAGGSGYYALFCEDPDRIKVELVGPDQGTESESPGEGLTDM